VLASATGTNEVVAIDEKTLKVAARMPGGAYPDGMAYAPDVHKLYVSDETGKTETVIDVSTNRRVKTIALDGEVGNTQYDPVTRHIFVNVQTRRQLVEIDLSTDAIAARIDLPGADGNHGLLIVAQARLAFIACEGNSKLLVLDMRTMRVSQSFDVGRNPDVLALDDSASTCMWLARAVSSRCSVLTGLMWQKWAKVLWGRTLMSYMSIRRRIDRTSLSRISTVTRRCASWRRSDAGIVR
jgi:DNA-binding beta-propeller fold protein YncE